MLLIIDKHKLNADTVADIFIHMGVISYATTPECAASEFSNRHKAILFIHPENIIAIKELVEHARTFSLGASVFAICSSETFDYDSNPEIYSLFDAVFPNESMSSRIICDIIKYQTSVMKPALGSYRLAGIDASIKNETSTYFDKPINLTKTENMIMRFLIVSYPIPQKTTNIMRHVFRPGKLTEPASIRTHISSINKKFMALANRRLISSEGGKGYHIVTV